MEQGLVNDVQNPKKIPKPWDIYQTLWNAGSERLQFVVVRPPGHLFVSKVIAHGLPIAFGHPRATQKKHMEIDGKVIKLWIHA